MFHTLLQTWFDWVRDFGYLGIFVLMVLESSVVPIRAEIVVPPAAYWAAQGRFSMALVLLVATSGSLVGSLLSYAVSALVGRPIVLRYGRYFLFAPAKVEATELLVSRYGSGGIFFARLLPVIRHLISIPAGLTRMNLRRFVLFTVLGAGLWAGVLAWFGREVIGQNRELLTDPNALEHTLQSKLGWFVGAAVVLLAAYVFVTWLLRRAKPESAAATKSA